MKKILLAFLSISFLISCNASKEYSWQKKGFEGKTFKKIAVITVGKEYAIRQYVENQVAKDLKEYGIETVLGHKILPVNATEADWKTENIAKIIKELGVDGALGITVVNVRDVTEFTPGSAAHNSIDNGGFYGGYIYGAYSQVNSTNFYDDVKQYVVESSLYNTKETTKKEALLWKGQSTITNPAGIEKESKEFANNLVNTLLMKKVVLPNK